MVMTGPKSQTRKPDQHAIEKKEKPAKTDRAPAAWQRLWERPAGEAPKPPFRQVVYIASDYSSSFVDR